MITLNYTPKQPEYRYVSKCSSVKQISVSHWFKKNISRYSIVAKPNLNSYRSRNGYPQEEELLFLYGESGAENDFVG